MTPEELRQAQRMDIMEDQVEKIYTGLFKGDQFAGDGGFIKKFYLMADKVESMEAQMKKYRVILITLAVGLILAGVIFLYVSFLKQ